MSRGMDEKLTALYPPFGLVVAAGDITLRLFRDSDLPAYAELISSSLFADESAHFVFDWWARDPAIRLSEGLQWLWRARSSIVAEDWTLTMGVFSDGRLIGAQDIAARNFVKLGVVGCGSMPRGEGLAR